MPQGYTGKYEDTISSLHSDQQSTFCIQWYWYKNIDRDRGHKHDITACCLSEGWWPYLHPMKFVSFNEVRVSSWSLLHFEDSIGVVDQILDKDRRECTSMENCIRLWRILGNSKLAHGWLPYISLCAKLVYHHLLEPVLIILLIMCPRDCLFWHIGGFLFFVYYQLLITV